jgi:peptide chain release factor 1
MFDKLEQVEERFELLERAVSDPSVVSDRKRFADASRELAELREVVEAWRRRKDVDRQLTEARAMREDSDPDIREMAVAESRELATQLEALDEELKILLIPKDPMDRRNAILEIRAGTGGEEAALFGGDLLRMYTRYCERNRYRMETLSLSEGGKGGVKEAVVLIAGDDAYGRFKYEGGVHRVQRVPETEAQGRIHTSAVTVAVLPEAEEVDVELDEQDLRYDVYRSSGAGGQSAVRITHIPTGLVVTCQDERSQHKNKAKARKILLSRLLDMEMERQHAEISADRRAMVGSGDRSERIRTYNFPQGRITDHRIGLTLYSLESFIEGEMDEVLDALRSHYQAEALKAQGGA